MAKILIIEKDQDWKEMLWKSLIPKHQAIIFPGEKEACEALEKEAYDLILLDLQAKVSNKTTSVQKFKKIAPYTPVVVTSEAKDADVIVRVIKAGATDFVTKPYTDDKILLTIDHALENKSMKNEIDYLRRQQDVVYDFKRIIAVSPPMKKVVAAIKKFAHTDSTVLVTGDSGTGKSFLSGTIHFNSPRRDKPFIKINCANLPETLLESELFGHEKGAFTGADKTRAGRFEQANGGTVFLDEIGEMTQTLQAKLLRVLEEKSFERVGGNRTIHSDIRIIAATNRNLEERVSEGKFREDLYYRINVLRFHLPPLRERIECIEPLADTLLKKACRSLRKEIEGFSPEVIDMFKRYSWPGNIRELSNTIERAVLLEDSPVIRKENVFVPNHTLHMRAAEKNRPRPQTLDEHEKQLILEALEECLWIQKDAAKRLGLTPRTLNYKIKRFGIKHPRWRKNK